MAANDIIPIVAISFMQKIRLAVRGWLRRREQKDEEFLRRNANWGAPAAPAPATIATPPKSIDIEGLQAAYLDGSGQIAYFLDVESGDVIESRDSGPLDPARFKRVPSGGGDVAERRAFIETLGPSHTRDALMKAVNSPAFRSVLASDRTIERAWYNFRTARATAAIEAWLKTVTPPRSG
jgi:hypothetical protein